MIASNPDVLRVDGSQAVAIQDGDAGITGTYSGLSARVAVTVLETGTSPGSAFNEVGPGTAGPLYAGNGATTNTPANSAAVSQYDVACFKHQ